MIKKNNNKNMLLIYLISFCILVVISLIFIILNNYNEKDELTIELKKTACYSASSLNNCDELINSPISSEECCELFDKCCLK
ncbi:MAG: hypothetical protein ACOC3X_00795 [Nanoarchaeota archaeon]